MPVLPSYRNSQFICTANQLTSFYTRAVLAFNWLNSETRWKVTKDSRLKRQTNWEWSYWLMHHVKVILILLLKNMSHQKIHVLILPYFVVDNEIGIPSTFIKTTKQTEFVQKVVLPKVSKLNVSLMRNTMNFFPGKIQLLRKIKMYLSNSQMDSPLFLLLSQTISHQSWIKL